ncbi:MAG: glycosyltransferase [Chthoniobacterales bacterium]
MIRVLHIIDHLGLGGAQSALLDLVGSMDRSQFHIEVATMHGRGLFADQLEAKGVKVHSLAPGKWPPVYIPNLVQLLRNGRYDLLHFHLQGSNWLAKPFSAFVASARRVAHDHSSADLRFRKWWSLAPDAAAHLFSHRVVAVSRGVADFLRRREFVPASKIAVVPNGVDTKMFRPVTPTEREKARTALGASTGQFVAGALGRLAPEKNFQSLAALAHAMPDVLFVIGGTGPERDAVLAASGGAKNLRLLGEVSDRPLFYAALDVLILPSLHEALPMTVLEAMASGVPVIASNLEGVSSALGGTGLLVPAGDMNALENALRSVVANSAVASRLSSAARERVTERYDARLSARKIEDVYHQLVS